MSPACKGFSLIELMVVMFIMSLSMAVVSPQLAKQIGSTRLRSAAGIMVTLSEAARYYAVTSGEPVGILISDHGGTVRLVGVKSDGKNMLDLIKIKKLPGSLSVSFVAQGVDMPNDDDLIRFYPDGSSDSGRLVFEDDRHNQFNYSLSGPTGKLSFKGS
jgi:type II secretion system protein H